MAHEHFGGLLADRLMKTTAEEQQRRETISGARLELERVIAEQGEDFVSQLTRELAEDVASFNRRFGREYLVFSQAGQPCVRTANMSRARYLSFVVDPRTDDGNVPTITVALSGVGPGEERAPHRFIVTSEGHLGIDRYGALLTAEALGRLELERFVRQLPIH